MSHLKLPVFSADAPMAWFAVVEAQFKLQRIWSEEERFCNVTAALDKMTLKKVVHLVVTPDIMQPYSKLEEALLTSHQLTDFQRVELILAMEPLGSRKPSELLADMWEVCPSDEYNSKFSPLSSCSACPATSGCCSLMRTIQTCGFWRRKRTSW